MRQSKTPSTPLVNTPEPGQDPARRRRNALWISAITVVVMTTITIFVLVVIQREQTNNYTIPYLTGLLVLAALVSFWLSYRNQTSAGIGTLIGGMMMLTILLPYLAPGQAIAPALASIIMVTTIASATLPTTGALRASIVAVVLALAVVVLDQFLPAGFGIQSSSTGNLPISAGLVTIYAIIVLWRYRTYNLRAKILIAFIFVAFIPLASLGTYNTYFGRLELEQRGQQNLSELSQTAAAQVDTYINNQLNVLRVESQQPSIAEFINLPASQRAGSQQEANALRTLNAYVHKDPLFIYSYALLDLSGRDILDTDQTQIGRNEGNLDYFTTPIATGLPYVSNLTFEANNKANIHFSAPVRSIEGNIIGVIRAEYNPAIFQTLLRPLIQGSGHEGELLALVDEETFVRVAYTGERNHLYKSFFNYGPMDMAILQSKGRLLPGTADDAIFSSAADVTGIQNLDVAPFYTVNAPTLGGNAVTTGAPLNSQKWVAIARQSEAILYEPIRQQSRNIVLISVSLLLLAALAALVASQIISTPLLGLTGTAEKLAAGDLNAQAVISTNDEIGQLAVTFNRMSDQIKQTLQNLELRVVERTSELDAARRQSEARAHDLEVISDVARIISSEQKLDSLLPLITNLVTEKFGYYHTGIFLLDSSRQFAILQAASSEGGKQMLKRGHRLEVGQTGIVGYVAQTGQPRIALDVGADAVFFNNPDLPNTRSEIALPLNARGQTIGVLDMQSIDAGVFTVENLSTLTVLADQVAIAIDNARLFGQTETALAEVQSVYRQYIIQEWTGFARRNQSLGYRQTLQGGTRLEVWDYPDEARAALERGEVILNPARDGSENTNLSMPVKLRNQVIGIINVQSSQQGHEWSTDEIGLVQAVSDRMALALENARLFEESTRRAELERLSADLAGKIGSSIRLESILQITAQELSQALGGGTEVLVQVQPIPSTGTNLENPQPARK